MYGILLEKHVKALECIDELEKEMRSVKSSVAKIVNHPSSKYPRVPGLGKLETDFLEAKRARGE